MTDPLQIDAVTQPTDLDLDALVNAYTRAVKEATWGGTALSRPLSGLDTHATREAEDALRVGIAAELNEAREGREALRRALRAVIRDHQNDLVYFTGQVESLRVEGEALEARMKAIDEACLKACPENTTEVVDEVDPERGRYLVCNENGDEIIDTDDPAEVVLGLRRLLGIAYSALEEAESRTVELENALHEIVDGAPETDPGEGDWDSCEDAFAAGLSAQHYACAEVARAVLGDHRQVPDALEELSMRQAEEVDA